MSNPLTSLRKLGIAMVGSNGLLSTAAATHLGYGPLDRIKLQEQARKSALDEAKGFQGLETGNIAQDTARLGNEKTQFDLMQAQKLAPGVLETQSINNKRGTLANDATDRDVAAEKLMLQYLVSSGYSKTPEEAQGQLAAVSNLHKAGVTNYGEEEAKQLGLPPGFYSDDIVRIYTENQRAKSRQIHENNMQSRAEGAARERDRRADERTIKASESRTALVSGLQQKIVKEKNYSGDTTVINKIGDMEVAYNDAVTKLGSKNPNVQLIITNFNKVLDPDSVVRESEYDRSREGESIKNQLKGIVQGWKDGGGLTPEVLAEYMNLARQVAARAKQRQQDAVGGFRLQLGQIAGMTPEDVENYTAAYFPNSTKSIHPTTAGILAEAGVK